MDEKIEEAVRLWLDNGGREELAEAIARAEKANRALVEDARPDPATLNQPMTI